MKAKTPRAPSHALTLSVGLIVKNEVKTLGRCLDALQPLLDAVPSELIIADTGSTDETVEIAKRYTGNVFHFDWCDDFAAARNSTLERAKGAWYMYMDADEWFDNVDELIEFFTTKEKDLYQTAAYKVKSYRTYDMEGEYTESFSIRLIRNLPDVRFQSPIHEYLPALRPCKFFYDSFAHHFGYATQPGEKSKKTERNLPILMKKLETGEDLTHTYCQLGREYMVLQDGQTAVENFLKAKETLTPGEFTLRCMIYHDLAQCYYLMGKRDEVIANAWEYYNGSKSEATSDIDIAAMATLAYRENGRHAEAVEMFRRYQRLCGLMDAGKLDDTDRLSVLVKYFEREPRTVLSTECAKSLFELGRPDEALELVDECLTNDDKGIRMPLIYALEQKYVRDTRDFDRYRRRYDEMAALDVKVPIRLLRENIVQMTREVPETLPKVMESLLCCKDAESDWFIGMMRLRLADSEGRREEALLQTLLRTAPAEEEGPGLVYYALKWQQDFSALAQRVDLDNLTEYFDRLKKYGDVGEAIRAYFSVPQTHSLPVRRWEISLLERYLLGDGRAEDAADLALFEQYCSLLGGYVAELYDAEVLADGRIRALPRAHRFGLRARDTFDKRDTGDTVGFIRDLGELSELYPPMAPYIGRVLMRVQEEQERLKAVENEKAMLYLQIREKIRAMILAGDRGNAAQVLRQYETLNPRDEAIPYLWQQLEKPLAPS